MKLLTLKRSENVCLSVTLSIFFAFISSSIYGQVGLHLPKEEPPLVPLLSPADQDRFSIADAWENQTIAYPKSFVYKTKLDSAGEQVSVTYRLKEYDIFAPQYLTLDQYLKRRSQIQTQRQWQDHVYYHLNDYDLGKNKSRGLSISTPKIESKAFRSIFGGDRMSLNVTGQITIDGGMRNEKRSQNRTALNRGANTNFEMKQTQQFKVEGKIGENVSIFVDQNSERTFEFENAVKIKYSSDEDGIVKSIDAGNVSLSLPGTRFVTVGGSSAGLFGVKTELKVGALDITAIASVEKSQKKKLNISGGQQEEELTIEDYNYKKWTYFFLDDIYRENFENYSDDRLHIINENNIITKIEVYKYDGRTDESTPHALEVWAVPDPENTNKDTLANDDPEGQKWWMINIDPSEYDYFPEIGAIALNTSLMESEVLAVAFIDASGRQVGKFYSQFTDSLNNYEQTEIPMLKLIKARNPQANYRSWDLEWKNVYSLGGRNIEEEGFQCTIYRINPGGEDYESAADNSGNTQSLLHIFGLDETNANGDNNPDNEIDFHENFLNLRRGELIFPNLRPFDPEDDAYKPFPNSLDEFRNSSMYDTTNTTWIRNNTQFYMAVKSTSARSSSYDLGLNVVEGSEEITLNGQKLVKDQDYVIDYFSGNLTLLSERALDPNANLDISYESQQMFSVDRKTLWGARAEYTLWERGASRSFIGGTFLSLNEKTLDQKVRVGKGPMSNSVWDVNGALKFESEKISKFLNDLPVLSVNGKSTFNFEGEVAQVLPNPNTLNNNKTGDHDGVAYLDDFEGARRQVNLGVAYNMWSLCSPPKVVQNEGGFKSYTDKDINNRSNFYWYNPIEMVLIRDVWPEKEVTTQMGGSTHTHALTFYVSPNSNSIEDRKKQWNGVMRGLSSGYHDQTESRFLEIWVQGTHGRLNIDLGTISEDVIPNKKLDTEDQKDENGIRNKQLDEGEDTGLDGMFGPDPEDPFETHKSASVDDNNQATPYDFWDLNGNKIKEENEPWSYDDYKYADKGSNYDKINGTEDNEAASVAIYPDTEDLNGNSGLDITNNYYEYSFSLEEDHPDAKYVAGSSENSHNWRLYRIPLDEPSRIIGSPEWTRIENARIWVDSVYNESATIKIVEINIVGNEWMAMDYDSTNNIYSPSESEVLSIAVLNTHDNASEYVPPKGVEGVRDPIQKIKAKEQALQLKIQDLMPNEEVVAQKRYLEDMDLINYKVLKMYVHGGERMVEESNSDATYDPQLTPLEFYIQFSSDAKNENYYEVSIPVYEGWDYNNIEVPLEAWSSIKLDQTINKDSIVVDEIETFSNNIFPIINYLLVKGNPSFRKIRTITIGIRNTRLSPYTGEVWLNELRLSNVRKDKGMAMRFSGNISLGDFFKINGGYDRKDADFRTVSKRLGEGDNTEGFNINSSIQVDRVLPQSWGIKLPVSVNYKESKSTPKYIPGSDILTKDAKKINPDTVEVVESFNKTEGISVSFSKQRSRNKFLRYLLDPVSTSFSYSNSEKHDSQTKRSKNTSYRGSIGYNLRLGKETYVTPLSFMGKGIFKKVSALKFYYLPSNVTVKMSGSDTWRDALTRSKIETKAGDTRTATFSRSLSSNYSFTDGIDFQYSRDWAFDMRDPKIINAKNQETSDDTVGIIGANDPADWQPNTFYEDWKRVFTSLKPGDLRSEKQTFSGKVNLKLFQWLKNDFSYGSNYQLKINPQMKSEDTKRSTQASNNIKISGTLDPKKFVDGFKKKKSRGSSRKSSRRSTTTSRRNRRSTQENTEKKDEKSEEKGNGYAILLKPLSIAGDLFSKIDPIRITYTQNKSGNHYGVLNTPPTSYQFGFDVKLDTVYLSDQITSNQSTLSDDNRLSLSSGFKIISSLTVKLDYLLSDNEKKSTQRTGSITQSALLLKDGDPIAFPNWTVSWRGLEKLPYIKKYVQSASLNHTFSGKKTENWSDTKNNITTSTFNKDFRPLVGMSMTFKNKMSMTFQYNTSIKLQEKNQYGAGRTRQINNTMNFSVKYQRKGGIRIPLFGNKKLNNNIDFSMAVTSTLNRTEQSNSDEGNFSVMSETKNWSVKPQMTYSFTNAVRGGVHFELGEREDKRTGKTKITALGINAVISLSGR